MQKISVALLILVVLVVSCTQDPGITDKDFLVEKSAQEECEESGGNWTWVQSHSKMCVMPYADANQLCTSSNQCEGDCVTNNISNLGKQGICQPNTDFSGCWNAVENEHFECLLDDIVVFCEKENMSAECRHLMEEYNLFFI